MTVHSTTAVVLATSILLISAPALAQPELQRPFTAQTKARIAVMTFVDTNADAQRQKLGQSVSGMLVTFFKRKSQFVVVERQQGVLDKILKEWKREETGVTEELAVDQQTTLTPIDAILEGNVTVLGEGAAQRIEVDARLLAKNANIVSVSNKSGPVADVRNVVERLGIDLEQAFLRPYYGTLTVTVPEPTKVRIFLTPILSQNATDDEKPPIELDRTKPERDETAYRKWVTAPNVATISNLLGGWYTVRFERPGYDGVGPNTAENGRLVVVDNYGEPKPMTRMGDTFTEPSSLQRRFLVHIRPLDNVKWPADAAADPLRKRAGSIKVLIKREFLDTEYRDASEVPGLTTIVESRNLALNDERDLISDAESADPGRAGAGVDAASKTAEPRSCGIYSFQQVRGGQVVIADYHRLARPAEASLPIGSWSVLAWLPQYTIGKAEVEVQSDVHDQTVMIDLKRSVGTIRIQRAGDATPNDNLYFEGAETKFKRRIPLDFEMTRNEYAVRGLPLDSYAMYSDMPGFRNWRSTIRLVEADGDKRLRVAEQDCRLVQAPDPALTRPAEPQYVYLVKAQPWLAGRLQPASRDGMRSFFDPNLQDRHDITELLDTAIAREEAEAHKNDQRRPGAANEPSLLVSAAKPKPGTDFNDPLQELRVRLGAVDLLYLTDADTKRIASLPKIAALVRTYVDSGGAVFCLVSSPADYAGVFGAAIPLDSKTVERGEMEIRPGSQAGLQLDVKIDFKTKSAFPMVQTGKNQPLTGWRVLAYRKKGQKEPVVVEKGEPDQGGYVLAWIDKLDNLQHETAREALAAAEKRAITWSQHLMFRRFGPDSDQAKAARERLSTQAFSVRRQVKAD